MIGQLMSTSRFDELNTIVPEFEIYGLPPKTFEVDTDVLDPDLEHELTEFNKKIDSVEADIDVLQKKTSQVKDIHKKAMTASVTTERNRLKEELSKVITSTSTKIKEVQSQLEKIRNGTEERKKKLKKKNTAEIRMREAQHIQMMKRFGKIVTEYQEVQAEYQKHYKDRMKRSVKITNPNLTEKEIDELMESSLIGEDAYKKKLLTKSQKETVNAYFDEAVETRRDVVMLEESLIELQDMFIAMAQLVAQQDDLIDNIEYNVMGADELVKEGIRNIVVAQSHQEKSKWVLYMIIISVVVFVIVAIICILLAIGGLTIGGIFLFK